MVRFSGDLAGGNKQLDKIVQSMTQSRMKIEMLWLYCTVRLFGDSLQTSCSAWCRFGFSIDCWCFEALLEPALTFDNVRKQRESATDKICVVFNDTLKDKARECQSSFFYPCPNCVIPLPNSQSSKSTLSAAWATDATLEFTASRRWAVISAAPRRWLLRMPQPSGTCLSSPP